MEEIVHLNILDEEKFKPLFYNRRQPQETSKISRRAWRNRIRNVYLGEKPAAFRRQKYL